MYLIFFYVFIIIIIFFYCIFFFFIFYFYFYFYYNMSSNLQKIKNQLFTRRMILDLSQKLKTQKSKTKHFNILSIN